MKINKFIGVVLLQTMLIVFPNNLFSQVEVHPNKGVALIWYDAQENLNDRNGEVSVGQIMMMWRHFEPTEGDFQFDNIDEQLKAINEKGMKTTVQINGNIHPDFVYHSVPFLKGIAIKGTSDHTIDGGGAPMYWHPIYKEKYSTMVKALANHLLNSPYKDVILGIRQSYCAVGTEHHNIPNEYRNKQGWHLEEGTTWGEEWPWTEKIGHDYKTWAVDLFIDAFNPPKGLPVFIRACAISTGIASQKHVQMVENGELYLFQTSSEPQPRYLAIDKQYQVFIDYCKTGKTIGFMESWSKATTHSDGWRWTKTTKTMTKAQFNYWTLLCDLHCGATFLAMRPEDVDVPEYHEDYEFAAKYAGYAAHPEKSPGAWIAFREGDFLVGDYTFLMQRDEKDESLPVYCSDNEKYGLWARRLEPGKAMTVKVDQNFVKSLNSKDHLTISVIYKLIDDISNAKWETSSSQISANNFDGKYSFQAEGVPILIHKIEITRN